MMYGTQGQPHPGGQYGAPPPGGQYGAPPPVGQYGAPPPGGMHGGPPPGGPYGEQPRGGQYSGPPTGQQPPPSKQMAGLSLQTDGRQPPQGPPQFMPPPGGNQTLYQNLGAKTQGPPLTYSQAPIQPPSSGNFPPAPSGGQMYQQNFENVPPPNTYTGGPPQSSSQPNFRPPASSGQAMPGPPTNFGPPPTSGHPMPGPPTGYGPPPPISGQGPPSVPVSGQQMPGAPPASLFRPPHLSSGQGVQTSGQPQMTVPPSVGMRPGMPFTSGQSLSGQPPATQTSMPSLPPQPIHPPGPMMGGGVGIGGQMFGGMAPPRGPMAHPGGPMAPPRGPMAPPGGPMSPPGGSVQQQPRTRIDPDLMPNPVAVMKLDQEQRGSAPFYTSSRGLPPPLTSTSFSVVDDGSCSPRFMRSTMYCVPCSKDLLNNCRIPFGLVVQPLATIPDDELPLQLVDHGAGGPIRCNRCKTYMNPYVRFIDGGRQYLCPICQASNEVPPEYFCHLDHTGVRTDAPNRPELIYGSVEYRATTDYCKDGRAPKPPAYIFMIDVSASSVQRGVLALLSQTILRVLDHLPDADQEGGSPIQVGIVTYDKVLHFYNSRASLAQPHMMVVADISDVFVPMVDGFLVAVREARPVMESLLSQLPDMFSSSRSPEVILEPVVRAGMEALKAAQRNGRLFVFHSGLPSAQAPGQLKNRLDSKLLGTDKEKALLQPVSSPYQKLAAECVKHGVAVEFFLLPTGYSDVATLAQFVATTGGEMHLFEGYQTGRDGERLVAELTECVARPTAFDAVMRVRASTGLRPTAFFGAFHMQNTTDIELGNIDADKAIAVEIKHDDKIKEDEIAFFQAALLYTTHRGERRLIIHNLALNCSPRFQDLFRCSEIDTIINFLSKSVTHASLSMPYKTIRDTLASQCAVILSCYRKQCSSQSPAGQLILPESLKLLPMYINCLLKSDALLSPPIVSLDAKCWIMHCVQSMGLQQTGAFFYPRMVCLHTVNTEEKGLPPIMRCTAQKLQDAGVYAVENGFLLVVWVGQQVSHDFVSQVFGAPSPAQINTEMSSLPALDNPLSFRVRAICSELQVGQQRQLKLKVVKQRDKSETLFRRMLKEDKGAGQWEGTSYIDFLCQIHRDIKELLN